MNKYKESKDSSELITLFDLIKSNDGNVFEIIKKYEESRRYT